MAKRSCHNCRAVVTGASSGIGREIAIALAARGARQLLIARREKALFDVQRETERLGASADILVGDVTKSCLLPQLLDFIKHEFDGLDILVNNAGVGGIGSFSESSAQRLRQILEVNFIAPVEIIRATIPWLKQGNLPIIVNVGSVLGHVAVPWKSEYCASKFALRGFSDALRVELAPHDIDVLYVAPSTTNTAFFQRAGQSNESLNFNRWNSMTAGHVAGQIVDAIERGKRNCVLSLGGKFLVWSHRIFPGITQWVIGCSGKRNTL